MAVASDDFEDCTFEEEDVAMDDDDVSLGSEENEYDIGTDFDDEHNEEEAAEEDGLEENVEEEELREGSIPSYGNRDDGRFSYTAEELRLLKQAHIEISTVSNAKDLSMIHRAICDSNFF
ncbi:hypothetical protein C2845_PM12G12390 [Panicum miliaceum]|uniref:Uncharacterized protein n=1 Tax=Panicum miliaceum TaxID=4540 RepID=A0A3L6QH93_PANMI|nr:hypothetical protein C2845_PM12G12390 [Panicum miliaceum]